MGEFILYKLSNQLRMMIQEFEQPQLTKKASELSMKTTVSRRQNKPIKKKQIKIKKKLCLAISFQNCKQFIKSINQNTKKIDVKRTNFFKNLASNTQGLIKCEDFECPLCMQIMISPVIFQCGHGGCQKCIQTSAIYKKQCFICRKSLLSEYQQNVIIRNYINKFIVPNLKNPLQYYTRLVDQNSWKKQRFIDLNKISDGHYVDYQLEKTGQWVFARVKNIIRQTQNTTKLIVIYQNPQNKAYFARYCQEKDYKQEQINFNSLRVAKSGFFTINKGICKQNNELQIQNQIPQIMFALQPQNSIPLTFQLSNVIQQPRLGQLGGLEQRLVQLGELESNIDEFFAQTFNEIQNPPFNYFNQIDIFLNNNTQQMQDIWRLQSFQ